MSVAGWWLLFVDWCWVFVFVGSHLFLLCVMSCVLRLLVVFACCVCLLFLVGCALLIVSCVGVQ